MRRLILVLGVLGAIVLLPGAPAWAHNRLTGSEPAAGAALDRSPRQVTLRFAERLNPEFTTIAISDAARQRVPASAPVVDAGTGTVTPAGTLADGAYTVAYRTVSVDGHAVQGSFEFSVGAPVASPVEAGGGPPVAALVGLAVLGVGLAGVAIVIGWRARRRNFSAVADDH